MLYLGGQRGIFSKVVLGFRNFGYDFRVVGEMFEGDFGDSWAKQMSDDVVVGISDTIQRAQTGVRIISMS